MSAGSAEAFDQLDRQIAVALQVNGRASWRAVARGIDVPERTVARRGQAMVDSGLVKVSTYLDTTRVGHARPLIVVAHTEPGMSFPIGQELAKRADASSVSVLEGTGQLVCMLLPADGAAREELLHRELPSLAGLRDTRVATVLRYFRSGYDWYADGLGERAMAELRTLPSSDPERTDPVELAPEDWALVAELARDGRSPISALADAVGLSPPSVQRRLNRLFAEGAIHIRTEIPPKLLGLEVEVLVWIRVSPLEIDTVGRALATHPAVRFCAATTGPTQILLDCLFADENHLYDFLTGYVGAHGASEIANAAVVVAALRRGPLVVADSIH
ncbi:MAG: Lrp/AsnC family transcriptional regulator [Actinomycetota bacterium]|nr:Lrp/AsnC family transcriptional regulator [Actinomycetota bacterium]